MVSASFTSLRSANSSSQSRLTDSSSESDVIDKHNTKSNKHHTNLMPLAVLPSAIARSTNTQIGVGVARPSRGRHAGCATRCGRSRWSNRPALSYTLTLMKLMAIRHKAEIIGRMKILFDSRGINAANSARHGGGHRHGHSRALLRRDRGDYLLCFDQHRIFGLRLVAVELAPGEGRSPPRGGRARAFISLRG